MVDSNNNVKIKKQILLSLIDDLHRDDVISYWHCPGEVRNVIDEMDNENLIKFESTYFQNRRSTF